MNRVIEEVKSPAGIFNLICCILVLMYFYLCFFNKQSVFANLLVKIEVVNGLLILGLIALLGIMAFFLMFKVCYSLLEAGDYLNEESVNYSQEVGVRQKAKGTAHRSQRKLKRKIKNIVL